MSEAPASIWVRPDLDAVLWSDKPDAVRYVRADLYEALMARAQQDCLEWLGEAAPTRSRREDELVAEIERLRAEVEALMARMAVVRSWNEAPCLEPIDAELEAHKARLAGAVRDQSEANHKRMRRGQKPEGNVAPLRQSHCQSPSPAPSIAAARTARKAVELDKNSVGHDCAKRQPGRPKG